MCLCERERERERAQAHMRTLRNDNQTTSSGYEAHCKLYAMDANRLKKCEVTWTMTILAIFRQSISSQSD